MNKIQRFVCVPATFALLGSITAPAHASGSGQDQNGTYTLSSASIQTTEVVHYQCHCPLCMVAANNVSPSPQQPGVN